MAGRGNCGSSQSAIRPPILPGPRKRIQSVSCPKNPEALKCQKLALGLRSGHLNFPQPSVVEEKQEGREQHVREEKRGREQNHSAAATPPKRKLSRSAARAAGSALWRRTRCRKRCRFLPSISERGCTFLGAKSRALTGVLLESII